VGALLSLVRIGNVLVALVGTIVGGLAAHGAGLALPLGTAVPLLLAAGSTASVIAAGNILNDLGDRDSDRVNHPERPLVTGAVTIRQARFLVVALLVVAVGLVAPFALSAPFLLPILASALAAVFAYEYALKARGLPGNLLVAYLTAAVFLYGGAAVGALAVCLPFAGMALAATASREVIKDMEDAAGDTDRRTLPRVHGMGWASRVARGFVVVAIVLSFWPLVTFLALGSVAGIMYLAFVLAADAIFVVSVLWLPARLRREQSTSKLAMTVALLAFLAAAFR
jgi:geranylgeranylglycerol-phosphate geranylgeranyltransferase